MGFSPVFQHHAAIGLAEEPGKFGAVFQHVFTGGSLSKFGATFQHIFVGGSLSSFSPIFQHIADVAALGKIRGRQIEPVLKITRAIDLPEGGETTAPLGFVRSFTKDKTPRWVNEDGTVFRVDLGAIPLGGIISWWPEDFASPASDLTPPENFEFCDGTAVDTINSPYFGRFKPALMRTSDAPGATQRFIRGADTTTNYGGAIPFVTGGSEVHSHTGVTNLSGLHVHESGDHAHTIAIEPDHNHGNVSGSSSGITGGAIVAGAAAIGDILISDVDGPDVTDTEVFHQHAIGLDGSHDHNGFTGLGAGETAESGSHTHTITTSQFSQLPSYVELAWIVRVL